jgi:hypothetical protein
MHKTAMTDRRVLARAPAPSDNSGQRRFRRHQAALAPADNNLDRARTIRCAG